MRAVVAVVVFLGLCAFVLSDGPDPPAHAEQSVTELRNCGPIRRGPTGTSQGTCVAVLRERLAAQGIPAGHGTTFDADAMTAVSTLQRLGGQEPVGKAGPWTRRTLDVTASQSRCTEHGCEIVIGRASTHRLAALVPDDDDARRRAADVLGAFACLQVKVNSAANIVCQAVGSYLIDTAAEAIDSADARNHCLRISVRPAPGRAEWSPRSVVPFSGVECGS